MATPAGHSSSSSAPKIPPLPTSPPLAPSIGVDDVNGGVPNDEDILSSYHLPRPLPLWLNSSYAKHIVKGNFMTLSAKPKTVEPAEWIAHQGTSCCVDNPDIRPVSKSSKLSSTTAIYGTSYESFTRKTKMAARFATRQHVHGCLLARKYFHDLDVWNCTKLIIE